MRGAPLRDAVLERCAGQSLVVLLAVLLAVRLGVRLAVWLDATTRWSARGGPPYGLPRDCCLAG